MITNDKIEKHRTEIFRRKLFRNSIRFSVHKKGDIYGKRL
jgi:hypothetical protein